MRHCRLLRCQLPLFLDFVSSAIGEVISSHCVQTTRSTALGSALLAGSAIGFAGWNVAKPETLKDVNTKGSRTFKPNMSEKDRAKGYAGWKKAVATSSGWDIFSEED